jgi:hypothetical protein
MYFVPDSYKSSLFTDLQKNQIATKFSETNQNNVLENKHFIEAKYLKPKKWKIFTLYVGLTQDNLEETGH